MSKKLYVGNFPYSTTEEDLRNIFAAHGEVHSINIIMDRQSGRSKGFGFIEMENTEAAMAELDGKDLGGRPLRVNEAREKPSR